MNAIQTKGLSKVFQDQIVLHDVDLEIKAAECVAISGANGSGKTTLLRCLCGAIRPSSGMVLVYGGAAATSLHVRRLIGYVAHGQQVYPHLTVRENLMFAARMTDVCDPRQRVDELLAESGLRSISDRFPSRISRGMNQRLAIVRAVAHEPRIVLLDEPFTGLDRQGCNWLAQWIERLRHCGQTVCFATHSEEWSQRLAERVLHLQAGELQQSTRQTVDLAPRIAA